MANTEDENVERAGEPQPASNAQAAPMFAPPPAIPTQEGPRGIRFDFNDGARILLPRGEWHVEVELDTNDTIFGDTCQEKVRRRLIPRVVSGEK